jgi:hypothetical protein
MSTVIRSRLGDTITSRIEEGESETVEHITMEAPTVRLKYVQPNVDRPMGLNEEVPDRDAFRTLVRR